MIKHYIIMSSSYTDGSRVALDITEDCFLNSKAIVWALMWIRVTGPGAACGVITQSVCSIGMISKMYITAIEDLDTHILESLDAMGCTPFQKIRYGVLPQLTASFISTTIYRFDINLKAVSYTHLRAPRDA